MTPPLAGRTVASSSRRVVYGGVVHLTIRLADGTLTLTPEWMLRPAAAVCEIRSAPRLSLARLRDLRAYLDEAKGEAKGEAKVQPHRVPNDVRRELVASKRNRRHSSSLAEDPKTAKVRVSIPPGILAPRLSPALARRA